METSPDKKTKLYEFILNNYGEYIAYRLNYDTDNFYEDNHELLTRNIKKLMLFIKEHKIFSCNNSDRLYYEILYYLNCAMSRPYKMIKLPLYLRFLLVDKNNFGSLLQKIKDKTKTFYDLYPIYNHNISRTPMSIHDNILNGGRYSYYGFYNVKLNIFYNPVVYSSSLIIKNLFYHEVYNTFIELNTNPIHIARSNWSLNGNKMPTYINKFKKNNTVFLEKIDFNDKNINELKRFFFKEYKLVILGLSKHPTIEGFIRRTNHIYHEKILFIFPRFNNIRINDIHQINIIRKYYKNSLFLYVYSLDYYTTNLAHRIINKKIPKSMKFKYRNKDVLYSIFKSGNCERILKNINTVDPTRYKHNQSVYIENPGLYFITINENKHIHYYWSLTYNYLESITSFNSITVSDKKILDTSEFPKDLYLMSKCELSNGIVPKGSILKINRIDNDKYFTIDTDKNPIELDIDHLNKNIVPQTVFSINDIMNVGPWDNIIYILPSGITKKYNLNIKDLYTAMRLYNKRLIIIGKLESFIKTFIKPIIKDS